MNHLNDAESRRLMLYRAVMYALHHHDPKDERGASVFASVLVLLALMESTNPSVMPLADEILNAFGEARAKRSVVTRARAPATTGGTAEAGPAS